MEMFGTLKPGNILVADRAHDSNAIRKDVAQRRAWANILAMPQRKSRAPFKAHLYRERNLVERFFNELKHFRAVAIRYNKLAENYLAGGKLAGIRIWLRFNESAT